jgi:hypothetical protein
VKLSRAGALTTECDLEEDGDVATQVTAPVTVTARSSNSSNSSSSRNGNSSGGARQQTRRRMDSNRGCWARQAQTPWCSRTLGLLGAVQRVALYRPVAAVRA